MRIVKVATCNLAQWAMDFDGNLERTRRSILLAKAQGCTYRLGPELELCGYGCEDHFLEQDTFLQCWDSLAHILEGEDTVGILCDIGMPVMHRNVAYNCRVFCLDRKILLIRPKLFMADDGNYREPRWFSAWQRPRETEEHFLPRHIAEVTGQRKVPFGEAAISTRDSAVASETCEELFTPNSPHIYLGLSGVEIIGNGSGSHHQLRKLRQRIDLITMATKKGGGVYLYANQQGCDGGRLYYDGCAMIVVNGLIVAMGSQFSVREVEVVTASVDLEEVRSYRGSLASRGTQATRSPQVPRVDADIDLGPSRHLGHVSKPISSDEFLKNYLYNPSEEIAFGPACWLWDYLRRSGMCGYFLPLSGGADSSSTAALVGIMCQLVVSAIHGTGTDRMNCVDDAEKAQLLNDVRKITRDESFTPATAQELCGRILFTCYMGTSNSSEATKNRAQILADEIGSHHTAINIDDITESFSNVFARDVSPLTRPPQFKVHGGSWQENIALQNIQARSRMVMSYFIAQLAVWTRNVTANPAAPPQSVPGGALLVLGSANVDEALRGYFTKYDCSAADINPIGGIAKNDLKAFLVWAAAHRGFPSLQDVVEAPPTAELEPITDSYTQTDEDDMGMSYAELTIYGNLRKIARCGPVSMFERLCCEWSGKHSPAVVAEKVKHFFRSYAINRHKMTTLTPSYHAENYSPDDNRFDLRQFLYPQWTAAFRKIDFLVAQQQVIDEAVPVISSNGEAGLQAGTPQALLEHVESCVDCSATIRACTHAVAGHVPRKRAPDESHCEVGEQDPKRARPEDMVEA